MNKAYIEQYIACVASFPGSTAIFAQKSRAVEPGNNASICAHCHITRMHWFMLTIVLSTAAHERVALNRDRIVRFLAANASPGGLADKLLVAGLISEGVRERALVAGLPASERIRPMIDAVITRIELNHAKYDLFISVLRQFGSLEDLVQYIETTF